MKTNKVIDPHRNHRIAIKTCKNFNHKHYPNLVHRCDEVLKEYNVWSKEIVTGSDTKANRWARKYGGGRIVIFDTPKEMIEYSDVLILFGIDPVLERLASMANDYNVRVFRFTLY